MLRSHAILNPLAATATRGEGRTCTPSLQSRCPRRHQASEGTTWMHPTVNAEQATRRAPLRQAPQGHEFDLLTIAELLREGDPAVAADSEDEQVEQLGVLSIDPAPSHLAACAGPAGGHWPAWPPGSPGLAGWRLGAGGWLWCRRAARPRGGWP